MLLTDSVVFVGEAIWNACVAVNVELPANEVRCVLFLTRHVVSNCLSSILGTTVGEMTNGRWW